jgi:hypothetical protein
MNKLYFATEVEIKVPVKSVRLLTRDDGTEYARLETKNGKASIVIGLFAFCFKALWLTIKYAFGTGPLQIKNNIRIEQSIQPRTGADNKS